MKLYSYDHCPYCVKARMIFGFKNIPMELINLLNDDEETPISMVGKKVVPILQMDNSEFLPESMDIVRFCDQLTEFGAPVVESSQGSDPLNQWMKQARQYHYALAMPRWVKMGLPEFATQEAVEYFTEKKFQSIGNFDDNINITQELSTMAHKHLADLEQFVDPSPYIWGEKLNEDDFHLFATLRVLTSVKGLQFPEKINNYMNFVSEASKVPLHWDLALGSDL